MSIWTATVQQELTLTIEIEVEAATADEAEEIALQECRDGKHDSAFLDVLGGPGPDSIEYDVVYCEGEPDDDADDE